MDTLIQTFITNTTIRFGTQSFEVNAINQILETFKNAKLSKRDALSSITLALGAHDDLKEDLMKIILHEDAKWEIGDFDFHQLTCLPFLEPNHEPQSSVPSVSSPWCTKSLSNYSINPALLTSAHDWTYSSAYSYPQYRCSQTTEGRMRNTASSGSPYNSQLSSSSISHDNIILPSTTSSQYHSDHRFSSHDLLEYRNTTEGTSLTFLEEPWLEDSHGALQALHSYSSSCEQFKPYVGDPSHLRSSQDWGMSAYNSLPRTSVTSVCPSILGEPIAVPLGQPAIDLPSVAAQYCRKAHGTSIEFENCPPMNEHTVESHFALLTEPLTLPIRSSESPKQITFGSVSKSLSKEALYTHGLCGKAFASRAQVKKHHWGQKNNDKHTKTGCWAKHKKPDVLWDSHPSCKNDEPTLCAARGTTTKIAKRRKLAGERAPVVPGMVFGSDSSAGSWGQDHSLQPMKSELTHQTLAADESDALRAVKSPARSSFESLLTAVNLASQTEAPIPQGLHNSVVPHLDAQVHGTDQNQHGPSQWISFPSTGVDSSGASMYSLQDLRDQNACVLDHGT